MLLNDLDQIKSIIRDRIQEFEVSQGERTKKAQRLERELDDLREQRQWLITEARIGRISKDEYEIEIEKLGAEQVTVEAAYREAKIEIPKPEEVEVILDLIGKDLEEYAAWVEWLNDPDPPEFFEGSQQTHFETKRRLIRSLFKEIVIDPDPETRQCQLQFIGGPLLGPKHFTLLKAQS